MVDKISVFYDDVFVYMYLVVVDEFCKCSGCVGKVIIVSNKYDVIDFDFYGSVVLFFDVVV